MGSPPHTVSGACSTERREEQLEKHTHTHKAAHAHAARVGVLIKSTHVGCRSRQQRTPVTFRGSACVKTGADEVKAERGRERGQCGQPASLRRTSPSSITLNRKVIDYEQSRAEPNTERWLLLACTQPLTCGYCRHAATASRLQISTGLVLGGNRPIRKLCRWNMYRGLGYIFVVFFINLSGLLIWPYCTYKLLSVLSDGHHHINIRLIVRKKWEKKEKLVC